MIINTISVDTRHNRPSVLGKTALVTYFINDGQYTDPYEISGVSIFAAESNWAPSSVVTNDGEIDSDFSSVVLMHFAPSGSADVTDIGFNPSSYSAGASGIYRISEGVYATVLDTAAASAVFNLSADNPIENRVSAIGSYLDVWTVRRKAGSDLDTLINEFSLTEDRFFTVTEPLLFHVNTKLANNHIVLGSKVDIRLTNEVTLENANIDRSIINLFKQSLVIDPAIEIIKLNDDRNLASRVTVSGFAATSSLCDVTAGNTVIYNFDTSLLATHPNMLDGTFGSQRGAYIVRLKFNALDQIIYSNDLGFVIR
tara:strand:+ start:32645 stop:33580 length:936 start_codon:yes stop_codon:yes gene_type:complete